MNKNYFLKGLVISCMVISLLGITRSYAQYEQKLTIHGSGSFVVPNFVVLNEESIANEESFNLGIGIDGGIQYNTNRFFSWMANARYYNAGASDNEGSYDNIAFGGGFKINLAGRKKINPYILGEANLNIVWFEYYYTQPGFSQPLFEVDEYLTLGGMAGIGFDFRFNDNLGMFIQSSGYYTHYDSYITLYSQLGIRISLVKSRTI